MYSAADIALSAKAVCVEYRTQAGAQPVLHSVDIDLPRGKLILLLGPSGSGKTTLLAVLGALLTPKSGRVQVEGTSLYELPAEHRARLRLETFGFVFQSFRLLQALSALQNVALPLLLNGVDRDSAQARAQRILGDVGLGKKLDRRPPQMSGGEQQRVAIARALVGNPRVVLADEPTANLDQRNGLAVAELLKNAADTQGCAVVVVTHDSRLHHISDRVYEMEDGRLRS